MEIVAKSREVEIEEEDEEEESGLWVSYVNKILLLFQKEKEEACSKRDMAKEE